MTGASSTERLPKGGAQGSGSEGCVVSCCSKEGTCISVGVLGHVDSGKTSLCKALSQVVSTCGLDKHPQSKERGITLDLGFSAFALELPSTPHRCPTPISTTDAAAASDVSTCAQQAAAAASGAASAAEVEAEVDASAQTEGGGSPQVQICLVDCPGHASLVRTVIGGAHIIDMALLVVDVTKGVQAQTAECIVICQVIRKPLLVVLNKTDLIPEASRQQKVNVVAKKMQKLLEGLGFGSTVPVVALSAAPAAAYSSEAWGIESLKRSLAGLLLAPAAGGDRGPLSQRRTVGNADDVAGCCLLLEALDRQRCMRCPCCVMSRFAGKGSPPLLFCSDHAFSVRGKGTVVTGTVLRGCVRVGDTVTLLSAATAGVVAAAAKVKGIQRFRKDAQEARTGHRAAVCLAGVDPSHLERGLLAAPGGVPPVFRACVAAVRLIKVFNLPVESGTKFHCTVGHLTAIATVHFFGPLGGSVQQQNFFGGKDSEGQGNPVVAFDSSLVYEESRCLTQETPEAFALLSFERQVLAPTWSVLVGARLDVEVAQSVCRLAFEGRILRPVALPSPAGNSSSAAVSSLSTGRGAAPANAKPPAGKTHKFPSASEASAGAAAAEDIPLPLASLCVVRRKWRVGVVERFTPDGSVRCTCNSGDPGTAAEGRPGAALDGKQTCGFASRSLVVRGLFKDAHHIRRFAGFRVAVIQMRQEEAERQLERGKGETLYNACLSVCVPSFNCRSGTKGAAPSEGKSGCRSDGDGQANDAPTGGDSNEAGPAVVARAALVGASFGGKGKCHVELEEPLGCAQAAIPGGLAESQFCVALLYSKSCFDKQQPLFQH